MNSKSMYRKLWLVSAGALLSGIVAMAQMQPGGMPGGSQQRYPGTSPGMPGAEHMPGAMAGPSSGIQPSMADQAFIRRMFQSDSVEMKLGQMAQQKSQSDDVKQFAEKMVENRKRLDNQLVSLAKRLDVDQPKGPDKKSKQEIAKLESLSGPQFDQEYIRVVEIGHEKDVKSFKQAAQSAQDPSLQRTAANDEPIIEQHLQAIQKIAQTHNVQTEESKK